jgi:hypothetical protein
MFENEVDNKKIAVELAHDRICTVADLWLELKAKRSVGRTSSTS